MTSVDRDPEVNYLCHVNQNSWNIFTYLRRHHQGEVCPGAFVRGTSFRECFVSLISYALPAWCVFLATGHYAEINAFWSEHTNMVILQTSSPQISYYLVKPLLCVGVCKMYHVIWIFCCHL